MARQSRKSSRTASRSGTRKGPKKVPDEGRKVVVTNPYTGTKSEGTVVSLLSTQFTYTDGDSNTLFAFYDYPWEYA